MDTNILFDFFFERDPFSASAIRLFEMCDEGKVDFYLSSLSIANLAYHCQRVKKNPVPIIEVLLKKTTIVDLNKSHFVSVNHSRFNDYEDGLQYFAAVEIRNVQAIISRNKKDFKHSTIPIITPIEYLDSFDK